MSVIHIQPHFAIRAGGKGRGIKGFHLSLGVYLCLLRQQKCRVEMAVHRSEGNRGCRPWVEFS